MANSSTQSVVNVLYAAAKLLNDYKEVGIAKVSTWSSLERDTLRTADGLSNATIYQCNSSSIFHELEALDIREDVLQALDTERDVHRPVALRERVNERGSVASKAMNGWSRKVLKKFVQQPSQVENGTPKDVVHALGPSRAPPTPPQEDDAYFARSSNKSSRIELVKPLNFQRSRPTAEQDTFMPFSPQPSGLAPADAVPRPLHAPQSPPSSPQLKYHLPRLAIQKAVEAAKHTQAERRAKAAAAAAAAGQGSSGISRSTVENQPSSPRAPSPCQCHIGRHSDAADDIRH